MPINLSTKQEHLFKRSLKTIEGVKVLFIEAEKLFPGSSPDIDILKQQLENPFSIFICGEFNSGKSSLLNELGDNQLAAVGILPTTDSIQPYHPEGFAGLVFIDSPGTNSIISHHQELTENYLQHADIILFVTSVERPLSQSELDFLELVNKTWARKVIVVINKADLVSTQELEKVLSYVKDGLGKVFTEVPPIFTISTRTGIGMEHLQKSLLTLLAETERVRLKLRGPQLSLLVHLEELNKKNLNAREKILAQKRIFDQTLRRINERIDRYDLLFGVFKEKISELFTNLIEQLYKLIDDNFAFLALLRKRFTSEDDLIEERVARAIKEVKLDEEMEKIIQQSATTLQQYQAQILLEAKEDLQTAATLSDDSFTVPSLKTKEIDLSDISLKLKEASEKGINNFLTLGTAAAATGIGAHILSTAALFELSAFVITLVLTMFSLKAVPEQRQKAKQQLNETFRELQKTYTETLQQSLKRELEESLKHFTDSLSPRLGELEEKIAASQSLANDIESQEKEIKDILEEVEKL